jgi:hypothetical protein
MALDFSLLNTNAPAQIAGAYGRGQQEAQANLLAEQQLQQAQNQNALSKYQIDAARMQNESQNALNAKYAGGGFDPMSNDTHLRELYGMGAPGRAQAGEILKYRADQRKAEQESFNVAAKRHEIYKQEMGALATDPNLTKNTVATTLDKLVNGGLFSQAARDTIVQGLPDDLAALRASVMQDAKANLKGKDQLTAFLPELMVAGGNVINKNPLAPGGAGAVMGRVAMSDAQIEQNKVAQRNADTAAGHLGVSKGQLAVSQGQLAVAQQRLAKEGTNLDPAENAAISKAIIEGRLDPNRVNGRNAKILATTLMSNPDANVLELGVAAAGATASEKSLSTQTAKMSTAANEANQMANVVRDLSSKVDRTEFPTLNAVQNAVQKGTGDQNIVKLNTSINALVNSYARAISPTGAPTVSDKNHAREIINSAYSQGQLGGILDVMQQEMAIAKTAATESSAALKAAREATKGRGAAATAATNGPTAGAVQDGYRFKGGNPADKANWEKM